MDRNTPTADIPDERPQRRREWHGGLRSVGIPLLIVGIIIAALWYFQSRDSGGAGGIDIEGAAPRVGRPAPDFALQSVDGEEVSLAGLRGNAVVVNFWATWCEPCRTEMPDLAEAMEAYGDQGLVVLALNVQEDRGSIRSFLEEFEIDLPVLLDPNGAVMRLYRVRGLPATFFIDREGTVQFMRLGPVTDEDLEERIPQILATGGG